MADPGVDAADLQFFITGNEITIATTALYCYEWLVTLDQEINRIWARKWSLSTWIFAASRYSTLLLVLLALSPTPNHANCVWIIRLDDALQLLQVLALSLFTALRAFALYGQRVWVFILVFALSAVPFITDMVGFVKSVIIFQVSPLANICESPTDIPPDIQLRLLFATRAAVIAADVLVLLITWQKTWDIVRQSADLEERMALSEVLLRDGTVFFLVLLAVNVFQVLIHSVPSWSDLRPGSAFLAPITSIVVSRFFFNLRQVNELPEENSDSMPRWSSIHFSPNIIIGNLSAPLCFQEDDEGSTANESLEFATEDTDESESTARYHTTGVDENYSGSTV